MFIIFLFLLISSANGDPNRFAMGEKVEAIGGKGGEVWDDGSDHDSVAKIYIRGGREGIQYIKFDYVKNEQIIKGTSIHGGSASGFTQILEFERYKNELIESVKGYYDEETGVIQSLKFKTNLKTTEYIGYRNGTKFTLGGNGKWITGFHGSAKHNLISLGAHLKTSPIKSQVYGNPEGGLPWDDGPFYDGIRKVYVCFTQTHVRSMNFDYDKDGQVVSRWHGLKNCETQEFAVDFPNDHLTSVEGTYNHISEGNYLVVTSLTFRTLKGKFSQTFGLITGTKFVLKSKGNVIVGFHGSDGGSFDSIGVYFSPMVSS